MEKLRAGIQDAFAQICAWITLDYEAAEALHFQALDEGRTWATNMALLYLLDGSLRDTGAPPEEIVETLRQRIAHLAAQEGQEDEQQ